MLEKLIKMIENAHCGMCINVEYYHVCGHVITIYKTPALIEDNRPLILVEGDLETATAQAYLLLDQYLNMTEEERSEIERMYVRYTYRKVGEQKDETEL
jgi:hypothetical protein